MNLLTFHEVATQLGVSLSLVQKLARAAEYQAEIRQGQRKAMDVPPGLVAYLHSGFPAPKRIGRTIRRVRNEDLQQWIQGE